MEMPKRDFEDMVKSLCDRVYEESDCYITEAGEDKLAQVLAEQLRNRFGITINEAF